MTRTVVIGGGVVGTACAYYLARSGSQVTLLDRGTVGGACSHANCGFVCPSHVLPHAAPGAVRATLATLFQKDSPLSVRLRFDPALWGWFLRFARRCTRSAMLDAASSIQALLNSSRQLYDELFKQEPLDAEWEQRGLLFAFRSAEAMHHYAETDRLLAEQFGLPAVRYDGDAVRTLELSLRPGLAGGYHYPGDAHLRPDRLMASWHNVLLDHGVKVREGWEFRHFIADGRTVRAVDTDCGEVLADAVVVAAGAWSPLLHEQLGVRLPIQPGKGYSVTLPRTDGAPTVPLIFEEDRVAVTPFRDGLRIGSTMEFAGYDTTMNPRRLALLRNGAAKYLTEQPTAPAVEEWWGWRPMVFDGKPVIGPVPRFDNVWVAAGHGMLGLSMAPATGKLVAELIGRATPHVDPLPYSATRF